MAYVPPAREAFTNYRKKQSLLDSFRTVSAKRFITLLVLSQLTRLLLCINPLACHVSPL